MGQLYSVRIIREKAQVVPGVYLGEFWKFCGVYVREYVADVEETDSDSQRIDLNILLTDNIDESRIPPAHFQVELDKIGNSLSSSDKRKEFNGTLKKMLDDLNNTMNWSDHLSQIFQRLYEVFCKYDYAYMNYYKHCLLYQMPGSRTLEMGRSYLCCYKELRESGKIWQDWGKEKVYLQFALLNCARKVNDICAARQEKLIFIERKAMMDEAGSLTKVDPQFTMGNVLAGMIGLSADELWVDGEYYLLEAIKAEKNNKHSSFICYLLGHSYEIERRNYQEAWKQYDSILNADPDNYRALFKMGCKMLREQDGEKAYEYFFKVYSQMEAKKECRWIQPVEIEYGYKCERILSESQTIQKFSSGNREEFIKKAESDKNHLFNESSFINEFVEEEDKKDYFDYFRQKLEGHRFTNIIGL